MFNLSKTTCALCIGLASLFQTAFAQVDAEALPGDPKLVVFNYDENNSFRIFTRPLAVTHIQLEADERVKFLTMGETTSWITKQTDNHVLVKPRYPDLTTPATMVTNKRTYQFVFRSSPENGRWYQRVSFIDPAAALINTQDIERAEITPPARARTPVGATTLNEPDQDFRVRARVEDLNYNYEIVGDAEFRPTVVLDDGTFTYIQLKQGNDVPAVFRLVEEDVELVEFTINGNMLKIPKVMGAGLLKLGKREIRFYNLNKVKKSWFGNIQSASGG